MNSVERTSPSEKQLSEKMQSFLSRPLCKGHPLPLHEFLLYPLEQTHNNARCHHHRVHARPLTSADRINVLILDDSVYHRARSRKVEFLERLYDHAKKEFSYGFRMLTLCWSDGNTVLPVSHTLLSTENPKNRLAASSRKIDARSNGAKQHRLAQMKAIEGCYGFCRRQRRRRFLRVTSCSIRGSALLPLFNIQCAMIVRYRRCWKFSCLNCRRCCHKSCENVHNGCVFSVTKLYFQGITDNMSTIILTHLFCPYFGGKSSTEHHSASGFPPSSDEKSYANLMALILSVIPQVFTSVFDVRSLSL